MADQERRAYEIFAARGYTHGQDLSDWLTAEAQLGEELSREGRAGSLVSASKPSRAHSTERGHST